jgi:hypothetical protein
MKSGFGAGMLFLKMLTVCIMFIPAVNAQKESDYFVTSEEAFKHANANTLNFIGGNIQEFENWTGASINPKPLELYDINGQKLFYQFSVYKAKKLIGRIDVCADKTLGPSINDIAFDPVPYKADEAMKKSKEIAKKDHPTGKIKSTNMVVYSYPRIGAMTIVKDKTSGVEYRIFVDAYTLNEIKDKPATETEPGVWSMYDKILANGKDNNLKEWQKSDQLTKFIEKAAANKGIDINATVTEENIKKLSGDITTLGSFTGKILDVRSIGQERDVFCGPACIKMLCKYHSKPIPIPTQDKIYRGDGLWSWAPGYLYTSGLSADDIIKWAKYRWGKTGILDSKKSDSDAVTEIENNRPFFSLTTNPNHFRICKGYINQGGYSDFYLRINDPLPVGSTYGTQVLERTYGSKEYIRIYLR